MLTVGTHALLFESVEHRLPSERRSKLLKAGAPLTRLLLRLREQLDPPPTPDRPLHVELLRFDEAWKDTNGAMLLERARVLQERCAAMTDLPARIAWLGTALVLRLDDDAHITIHYYDDVGMLPQGRAALLLESARQIVAHLL